jgi:hypothetical protein
MCPDFEPRVPFEQLLQSGKMSFSGHGLSAPPCLGPTQDAQQAGMIVGPQHRVVTLFQRPF